MKQCNADTEILARAYAIFRREAKQYASELEALSPSAKVTELARARNHAHRIKGGAGFFGLDELVKAAAHVESILKNSSILIDPNGFKESLTLLTQYIASLPDAINSKDG